MDIICIANTATISLEKQLLIGPTQRDEREDYEQRIDMFPLVPMGGVAVGYLGHWESGKDGYDSRGEIIGALICKLTIRLAFEDHSLRSFASYLLNTEPWGGVELVMTWKPSILSDAVISKIMQDGYQKEAFSKWNSTF